MLLLVNSVDEDDENETTMNSAHASYLNQTEALSNNTWYQNKTKKKWLCILKDIFLKFL